MPQKWHKIEAQGFSVQCEVHMQNGSCKCLLIVFRAYRNILVNTPVAQLSGSGFLQYYCEARKWTLEEVSSDDSRDEAKDFAGEVTYRKFESSGEGYGH